MRILHTSDWHLGRTFHGQSLADDHAAFTDHLVELVREESIDAVLVSGDVYDRGIPPLDAVMLLDDVLARLASLTNVILTSGNHDSASRLGFAAGLLREGISVRTRLQEGIRPLEVHRRRSGGSGPDALLVYALPYLDPDEARLQLPTLLAEELGEYGGAECPHCAAEEPQSDASSQCPHPPLVARSHEAVVAGALRLIAQDLTVRRTKTRRRVPAVVMSHAFVVGGQASEGSERDIRIGGVDSVPSELFATLGGSPQAGASGGIDYAAMGHLHRPQEVRLPSTLTVRHGSGALPGVLPRIVYSGSPVPFTFAEAPWPKSSVILNFGEHGLDSLTTLPTPQLHDIRTLRGTVEEILALPDSEAPAGAWVRAIIRGAMPPAALASLRERFPHLLVMAREAIPTDSHAPTVEAHTANPFDVCTDFFAAMTHGEPTTQQRLLIQRAYEAARAQQEVK